MEAQARTKSEQKTIIMSYLVKHGFSSVRDMAQHIGISNTALYKHLNGKMKCKRVEAFENGTLVRAEPAVVLPEEVRHIDNQHDDESVDEVAVREAVNDVIDEDVAEESVKELLDQALEDKAQG